MAKKLIWKDNTEPPKDRIWIRLDETGNIMGIYEYNGSNWIKIATGVNSGTSDEIYWTGTAENIQLITLDGTIINVTGDQAAKPNTIAARTATGQIKAAAAIEDDDVVTLKYLRWNNA